MMKTFNPAIGTTLLVLLLSAIFFAQQNKSKPETERKSDKNSPIAVSGSKGVVIDRRLAVLRSKPSLYAAPIKRIEPGKFVTVYGEKKGDGVVFYEVLESTGLRGFIQYEAVAGPFRRADDQRLARLIQASEGFDQLEMAVAFLAIFPESGLRASVLLLAGDLVEEAAAELSRMASADLVRRQMAASGAPLHSFYLNHPALDRYTLLGIRLLFNLSTRSFHYDGEYWFEVTRRYKGTREAAEAGRRLSDLKIKMKALSPGATKQTMR